MSAQPINKDDIIKGNPFADIAKEIELAVTQLTEFDVELKKVSVELSNVAKSSKSTIDGINAINLAEKQSKKIVDEKIANDKLLAKIKKEQQSAEQSLQRQREKALAQLAKEAQRTAEAERPYNKMSSTLNKLRKEYKDLAVSGQENTTKAKAMRAEIEKLDTTLKKVDASTGQFQRSVGNYTSAFGKMNSLIGQLGVGFSVATLFGGASRTIIEFDQAIADLVSITGAGGKDLEFFKKQAVDLGVTVKGGASAVIEAYKLIGSAKPELLENAKALDAVTQSAITLSKASGMDLPSAATALTDAMNQFGASADDANKFINVLGAGAKFGSAEIPQITEALLRFGAVAKTSNVSVEESTALIEDLAEKGLKGADAGTALRNVMLKLSAPDALPKEAQNRMQALGISFDKLRDTSIPFSERLDALKPLLKDNAALVKVFGTENAVAATTLLSTTDRIKELNKQVTGTDTAFVQAEQRTQTLSQAFIEFRGTFEKIILDFYNGSGAGTGFANVLSVITKNLPTIISTLAKLTVGFVAYRTAIAVANTDFKALLSNFTKLKTDATEAGGKLSGFGNALKGVGWSVAIGFAIELGTKLYDIASGAEQARDAMARFNKQVGISSSKAVENITSIQNAEKETVAKLNELLKDKKISAEDYLKLVEKAKNASKEELTTNIKSANERKSRYKQLKEELISLQKESVNSGEKFVKLQIRASEIAKELNIKGDKAYGLLATDADDLDVIAQLNANIAGTNERLKLYSETLKGANNEKKDYIAKTKEEIEAEKKSTQSTIVNTSTKKENTKEIENQRRALQDLADIENEQAEKRKTKDDERLARQIELGELIEDAKKTDRESEMSDQEREIQAIRDKYKRMSDLTEEFGYGEVELNEAMREEINLINTKYAQEEIAIQEGKNKELQDAETKKLERQKEIADELNKIQEGISDALKEQIDRRIEMSKKEEESAKNRQDFFENLAENGNITAHQSISEQIEIQRAAQEEQARLERKKQQIEMISAGLSTFNASIANGKTPASALAETILSTTTLVGILKNLNFFAKGTDNAPKGLAVVDEKGAEIITDKYGKIKDIGTNKGARFTMLDQGDKVLTATKTASFLNSMKIAEPKIDKAGNSMDLIKINETLKRIEAQGNGNSMSVDWGGISGGVANIVEKRITGRSRTVNVFRS